MILKGPSGFGDAIYTRVVAEWLLKNRSSILTVQTRYPNVFCDLPLHIVDLGFHGHVDHGLTYINDKKNQTTSQFNDMLKRAELPEIQFTSFLKDRKPTDDILIIYPYEPMNAVETSKPMKPHAPEFFKYCSLLDGNHVLVNSKINFFKLVNMFNTAKLVISQVGWAIPLAEMLDVPVITVFTKRALKSDNEFISTITPIKICNKPTTDCVIME